jgi:vacuolar-type H+-ATPase subunit F/Vma7
MDQAHRDTIVGHSLKGMDVHYLVPSEDSLTEAMDKYTKWLDAQISNLDQTLDQEAKNEYYQNRRANNKKAFNTITC